MALESRYPGLALPITEARDAGFSDEQIEANIRDRIGRARAAGATNEDLGAILSGEPFRARPDPSRWVVTQLAADIGKGIGKGATLGYSDPEVTPETSIVGRILGETIGGLGPGIGAFKLATPVARLGFRLAPELTRAVPTVTRAGETIATQVNPMAIMLQSATAGAGLGAAAPGTLEERAKHAALGAVVGGGAGTILGVVGAARGRPLPPQREMAPAQEIAGTYEAAGPSKRLPFSKESIGPGYEPGASGLVGQAEHDQQLLFDLQGRATPEERFATELGYTPAAARPATALPETPFARALRESQAAADEEALARGRFNVAAEEAGATEAAGLERGGRLLPSMGEPVEPVPGATLEGPQAQAFFGRAQQLGQAEAEALAQEIRQPTGLPTSPREPVAALPVGEPIAPAPAGEAAPKLSRRGKGLPPTDPDLLPPARLRQASEARVDTLVKAGETPEQLLHRLHRGDFPGIKDPEDLLDVITRTQDPVELPRPDGRTTADRLLKGEYADWLDRQTLRAQKADRTANAARQKFGLDEPAPPADPRVAIQQIVPEVNPEVVQAIADRLAVPEYDAAKLLREFPAVGAARAEQIMGLRPRPQARSARMEGAPAPRRFRQQQAVTEPTGEATPIPARGEERVGRVGFFGKYFGQATSLRSPLARELAQDTVEHAAARNTRLQGYHDWYKKWEGVLGPPGSGLRRTAAEVIEGNRSTKDPRLLKFAEEYREVLRDFARRAGLSEWHFYMTHLSDFDAMVAAVREDLAKPYAQIDPQWKLRLRDVDHAKYRALLERYPRWQDIPTNLQKDIKADLFTWDTVRAWEELPIGVRARLPKEIFSPYMLPREGSVFYKKDPLEAFARYTPVMEHKISMEPVLRKWKPVVEKLPGLGSSGSEREYMQAYMERYLLRRAGGLDQAVQDLIHRVNETIGRQLVNPHLINDLVTLYRTGVYTGALGPDTAAINLTQSLNTWAEYGKIPVLRFIRDRATIAPKVANVFEEFTPLTAEAAPGQLTGRVNEIARTATKWILSPLNVTENINKGIAWTAGLEDAARLGLNAKDAMLVGMGKASGVVPNLELTQAQLHAFRGAATTQFGYMPEASSPFVTGPVARLLTPFTTYPSRQIQFLFNGVVNGIQQQEWMKMGRFLALTGWTFGGGAAALSQMGVDVRNVWSARGLLPLSLPFVKMWMNGYNAVQGDGPAVQEKAQRDFLENLKTLFIPQYRYASKAALREDSVWKNVERGYSVDRLGRRLYDTSAAGELLRLVGLGPEQAYQSRKLVKTIGDYAQQYRLDRQTTMAGLLDGDPRPYQAFVQKYGVGIKAQEIRQFAKERLMTPEQRALRGVRQELRPRALDAAGVTQP